MNAWKLAPIALALLSSIAGCAADSSDNGASTDEDLKKAKAITGANAEALMGALQKADAPSDIPAGMLGVGGRVARLELDMTQGGMAHFISHTGRMSTVEGNDLGDIMAMGLDYEALSKALAAAKIQPQTQAGPHGSSSSQTLAKIECKQVVAPNAKPTCTVTALVLTPDQSSVLNDLLKKANAPSITAPGVLGVGSHMARVTLTTAQGGMAHFISQGMTVADLDGNSLGDLTLGVAWSDVRDAMVAGGGYFETKNGAHGSSSSAMVGLVECRQVVAPNAKPTCVVVPEPVLDPQ